MYNSYPYMYNSVKLLFYMIFIGLLDSQVSLGEFGCLQFMLKTVDGVIKFVSENILDI